MRKYLEMDNRIIVFGLSTGFVHGNKNVRPALSFEIVTRTTKPLVNGGIHLSTIYLHNISILILSSLDMIFFYIKHKII